MLSETTDGYKTNMTGQYDVIVLGGGTAGVIAAVQAGRAGARTLLVEKSADWAVRPQPLVSTFPACFTHGDNKL